MTQKAYLVGTVRYFFRAGEPAEIVGTEFTDARQRPARLVYRIRFPDGKEDLVPQDNFNCFQIISEEDVRAGNIPEVDD